LRFLEQIRDDKKMKIKKDALANVTMSSLLLAMPVHTKWVAKEMFDICGGVLFYRGIFADVVNVHIEVHSILINYYII
jgi:hypothetical protein